MTHLKIDLRILALLFSMLVHFLIFNLMTEIAQNIPLKNPGMIKGKNENVLVFVKSSKQGDKDILIDGKKFKSTPALPSKEKPPLLSLEQLSSNPQLTLPKEKIIAEQKTQKGIPDQKRGETKILKQKIDPTIVEEKMQALAIDVNKLSQSRFDSDGSMFDIGITVPEGVSQDELNQVEEVLYSFRRRIGEIYITKLLLNIEPSEKKYRNKKFPWTTTEQILRAKIHFDRTGNIIRVESLMQSNSPNLNTFFSEVMYAIERIPNPPKLIINRDQEFSLIFGLKIQ